MRHLKFYYDKYCSKYQFSKRCLHVRRPVRIDCTKLYEQCNVCRYSIRVFKIIIIHSMDLYIINKCLRMISLFDDVIVNKFTSKRRRSPYLPVKLYILRYFKKKYYNLRPLKLEGHCVFNNVCIFIL